MIRNKIIRIINNDGPGLRLEQLESHKYRRIEDKYDLIVPEYSVVGLLLYHKASLEVISSNQKGLMAHNAITWSVEEKNFKQARLSNFSQKVDRLIKKWLDNYDDFERKEFLASIKEILERAGIDSLLDIKAAKIPSLIKIIKESSKLDKKSKDIILDFINVFMQTIKEDVTSMLKDSFD